MSLVCIDDEVRSVEDSEAGAEIETVITLVGRAQAMTGMEGIKLPEKKNINNTMG